MKWRYPAEYPELDSICSFLHSHVCNLWFILEPWQALEALYDQSILITILLLKLQTTNTRMTGWRTNDEWGSCITTLRHDHKDEEHDDDADLFNGLWGTLRLSNGFGVSRLLRPRNWHMRLPNIINSGGRRKHPCRSYNTVTGKCRADTTNTKNASVHSLAWK